MNANVQIISKGLYSGAVDVGSPIRAKEYVFTREKGKKCLILRFLNESNISVTSFTFKLVQKNSDGDIIAESNFTIDGVDCHAGEIFSPKRCFFVNDKCVDFDVNIISVFSDEYEYKSRNGEGYVRYSLKSKNASRLTRTGAINQSSKFNRKVKFSTAILVFALFLIAFAVIWPFYNEEIRPVLENAIKLAWRAFIEMIKLALKLIDRLFDAIGEYFARKAS